ncbi:AAA family ATPase [Atlantibacter hermannii]|uniref:AAA family ATPase n=1 Tax=Atlantibacter hermannii TaxID=565 RepID=UPI00406CC338
MARLAPGPLAWQVPVIKTLHIENYRSIRRLSLELERLNIVFGPNGTGKSNIYKAIHLMHSAAQGAFSQELATEGGILKVFWAGRSRRDEKRRVTLAVETDRYEYELQFGFVEKVPYPSLFNLDPVIKEESIWLSEHQRRASAQLMRRKNQAVFLSNVHHEKVTHSGTLYENESVFGQLGEPHLYPEVSQMREAMRNWRFYHEFAVSKHSALREPQVGFRSPVLASDGANLAAAFQTIVEIGDEGLLMRILDQAFPGCRFFCENPGGRFQLLMQRDGLTRPLEPAEFSDGTLRFLCLAVALLSPRPPAFIALNEPENSLHPQMLPALAKLIAEASRYSQIWLTSHSPELAKLIEQHAPFTLYQLAMEEGETQVTRLS